MASGTIDDVKPEKGPDYDVRNAIKVLFDGQVYILRNDGAIYTLQGVRVR